MSVHRLHFDKSGIVAVESEKLVVSAALDNLSFVEHADEVGVADGRQAVGDDERGAVFHEAFECLLYRLLAFAVESRGRLVENEYRGFLRIALAMERRWR